MLTTIIATVVFTTNFQCIQYLDNQTESRPIAATANRTITRSIITLHGAHVVLMCKDNVYTATLL